MKEVRMNRKKEWAGDKDTKRWRKGRMGMRNDDTKNHSLVTTSFSTSSNNNP
jgi:hypothetical protein